MKLSNPFEQLLKKSFIMLFMKAIGAVISFFLTMLITRGLGAEEAGNYFFIISALLFFCSITSLGFNNAIIKLGALETDANKYCRILGDMVMVILFSTISVVVLLKVILLIFPAINNEILNNYYYILILLIFPFSLCQVFSGFFISKNEVVLTAIYMNIGYQIILLCMMTISKDLSLSLVFKYLVISFYSLILIFFVILKVKLGHVLIFKTRNLLTRCSSIFILSWPMMISQFISQLNNFSGLFLISIFASVSDISFYSVSMRVAVLLSFFSAAVSKVASRNFATLFEQSNMNELKELVAFSNRFLFLTALPFLIAIIFFGKQILLFFGEEFQEAYILLIILSFGQFISAMTGTVYNLLQMTGNERKLTKSIAISTVLSLCVGCILVPIYGVIGGALMTFISLLLNSLIACYIANSALGINPFKFFSNIKS
jgi:O-antigen/teichoic acid export membrane protein